MKSVNHSFAAFRPRLWVYSVDQPFINGQRLSGNNISITWQPFPNTHGYHMCFEKCHRWLIQHLLLYNRLEISLLWIMGNHCNICNKKVNKEICLKSKGRGPHRRNTTSNQYLICNLIYNFDRQPVHILIPQHAKPKATIWQKFLLGSIENNFPYNRTLKNIPIKYLRILNYQFLIFNFFSSIFSLPLTS